MVPDSFRRLYFTGIRFLLLFGLLDSEFESLSQSDGYIVEPVSFNSRINDEFSPVFYRGGIVFCSDESDNSLVSYRDDNNRLFKIFFVMRRGSSGWTHPRLLAKEITTAFNDGPATFNEKENVIFYSRNNSIENSLRNISDTSNKLGIYSAELIDGKWTNIRPFEYNNPDYSFCTPALTPDGNRIYFASDMPGGYGKMDLYYCEKRKNDWQRPVNLGPLINTPGNESFPFACRYDKLYFASDGLEGYGGKDLFYTQQINGLWIAPVHLDSAINSSADDFGLVVDSTFENGYFSSNRKKTDDIYSFSSPPVEFTNCDTLRENNYCFTFYDEKQQLIDTISAIYIWDFGDGIFRTGKEVKHCFPGPGKYSVKLTITDELTGDTIAKQVEYKVDLENIRQAYIMSPDVGIVDQSITFEGVIKDLRGPGITDYYWDLGDGFKTGGSIICKTFKKKGDYIIKFGLLAEKDSAGKVPAVCVMKRIKIYNNFQEFASKDNIDGEQEIGGDVSVPPNTMALQARILFMDDISGQQRSRIEKSIGPSVKQTITFDNYGIRPTSFQLLDNIERVLKEYPDLKLDINVHSMGDDQPHPNTELSELWARELLFYFKDKDIDMYRLRSKGFGLVHQPFDPYVQVNKTINGVLDLIFMKN